MSKIYSVTPALVAGENVAAELVATSELSSKSSSKKPNSPKKPNRKIFSVVKNKILALHKNLSWLTDDGTLTTEALLSKCTKKVVNDTDGYNESAFKKDIAMRMSFLLNDRKFHRKCWDAEWSLFDVAQKCAWANEVDFQNIRNFGIDHVSGFSTPDAIIYSLEELQHELKVLGFDEAFFENDPYTAGYKTANPNVTSPEI